jgi:tRNA threonylcarbamoyl adenosine modification protein (Sua5/YciO/YrdC/YwlC family)
VHPDAETVRYAAKWLERGAVVAIPTDTLYALAADAMNLSAVDEIFRVKSRAKTHALPILINSMEQAMLLARDPPQNFERLAEACWPGALTIVVDASNLVPLKVTANTRRIGLRWPKCETVRLLIDALGTPITGTSANLSGQQACGSAEEVLSQLGDRIPLIVDAGKNGDKVPSTIVELYGDAWRIGREGAVPAEEIEKALRE